VQAHPLHAVCKNAARIFEHLTTGVTLGESRKVDNAPGSYMAVVVVMEVASDGSIASKPREQADLARFVNLWMKNIVEQQRLEIP